MEGNLESAAQLDRCHADLSRSRFRFWGVGCAQAFGVIAALFFRVMMSSTHLLMLRALKQSRSVPSHGWEIAQVRCAGVHVNAASLTRSNEFVPMAVRVSSCPQYVAPSPDTQPIAAELVHSARNPKTYRAYRASRTHYRYLTLPIVRSGVRRLPKHYSRC